MGASFNAGGMAQQLSDAIRWQQKRPGRNRTDLPHHRSSTSASTSVVKSQKRRGSCERRIHSALISNADEGSIDAICVQKKFEPQEHSRGPTVLSRTIRAPSLPWHPPAAPSRRCPRHIAGTSACPVHRSADRRLHDIYIRWLLKDRQCGRCKARLSPYCSARKAAGNLR